MSNASWSGYQVKYEDARTQIILEVKEGVRGINVPVTLSVVYPEEVYIVTHKGKRLTVVTVEKYDLQSNH